MQNLSSLADYYIKCHCMISNISIELSIMDCELIFVYNKVNIENKDRNRFFVND